MEYNKEKERANHFENRLNAVQSRDERTRIFFWFLFCSRSQNQTFFMFLFVNRNKFGNMFSDTLRILSSLAQRDISFVCGKLDRIAEMMDSNMIKMKQNSEMADFMSIKLLNGKTRWEKKEIGDEIVVTYTIKVRGVEYVDKASTSGLSKTENVEEGINAAKEKARKLAIKKFYEAQKKIVPENYTVDIDRLFDSLN